MSEELVIPTTDLVLAAESSAATSDDFIRELKESFSTKVKYEQDKRTEAANKKRYEGDIAANYKHKAEQLLNGIWRQCRKSPQGHSFLQRVEFKGVNIPICTICKFANIHDENSHDLAIGYNADQIINLGKRLWSKDKEAGLILSYEELGRD